MSLAPKWTDETRRRRWIRAYIVNGACVAAALTQVIYAHVGCPVGYSTVFNGIDDPMLIVRIGATISLSAALLSIYGEVPAYIPDTVFSYSPYLSGRTGITP